MNRIRENSTKVVNKDGKSIKYTAKILIKDVENSAFIVEGWKYRQIYNLAITSSIDDAEDYLRQNIECKVGRCNLDKQVGRKLDSFVIKEFEIYEPS